MFSNYPSNDSDSKESLTLVENNLAERSLMDDPVSVDPGVGFDVFLVLVGNRHQPMTSNTILLRFTRTLASVE